MSKANKVQRRLEVLVNRAAKALDEYHTLVLKENQPRRAFYSLESERAASLLATSEDTVSQVDLLKRRTCE
jgi:hypothetical protein